MRISVKRAGGRPPKPTGRKIVAVVTTGTRRPALRQARMGKQLLEVGRAGGLGEKLVESGVLRLAAVGVALEAGERHK